MKAVKSILILLFFVSVTTLTATYVSYAATHQDKIAKAREEVDKNPELLKVFRFFMLSPGDLEQEIARFDSGKDDAEEEWLLDQASLKNIDKLGSTRSLEILPLIDWKTSDKKLKGEPGVSYLIKTDHTTVLFDVGFNQKPENPSPLMQTLKRPRRA